MPHFECGAIDHSATSPHKKCRWTNTKNYRIKRQSASIDATRAGFGARHLKSAFELGFEGVAFFVAFEGEVHQFGEQVGVFEA